MNRPPGTVKKVLARWRPGAVLLLVALLAVPAACRTVTPAQGGAGGGWVAAWGASPNAFRPFGDEVAPGPFEDQTLRQIARLSLGGDRLRVRFSNEFGATPLTIGAATVAVAGGASAIRPDTLRPLTFGGAGSITIPPGAPALSDPVALPVAALSELAISLYLPERTEAGTVHKYRATAFVGGEGDLTRAAELPGAEKTTTLVFLSGVYVATPASAGVIVALGDSITDGLGGTPHAFGSWPQRLAERLAGRPGEVRPMAVVNQGITGNQLLRDGAGSSALGRFDRDVLATPGLTHVVVLIGINDIGWGGFTPPGGGPLATRTAGELIAGYRQLIARAHALSPPVKIYGATLTPFEGTFDWYYSPEKDRERQAVNRWIRTSGEFDAVIDFDAAIRDPENPGRMLPAYDSGDGLHPGDAGYRAMAEAIDLALFE